MQARISITAPEEWADEATLLQACQAALTDLKGLFTTQLELFMTHPDLNDEQKNIGTRSCKLALAHTCVTGLFACMLLSGLDQFGRSLMFLWVFAAPPCLQGGRRLR